MIHPFAILGAVLFVVGAIVAALIITGLRRAARMPNAKSDALAESFASASEQSKAQARAYEVKNAPDSDVDARVEQLRERGRSGK